MPDQQERIVAVAIRWKGVNHTLPPPARHPNVIWRMRDELGLPIEAVSPANQGFLTNTGRFVDRIEACRIAVAADQIIKSSGGLIMKTHPLEMLFSEDLW